MSSLYLFLTQPFSKHFLKGTGYSNAQMTAANLHSCKLSQS